MHQTRPAPAAMNDEELAEAFAARAPGALDEAYRRHLDIMFGIARSVLGASSEAQDCVHDAILRVWLARDSYTRARGALRAFLIVCVRNDALSRKRAAARHFAIEQREARLAIENEPQFEERDHVQNERLHDALQTLPPEQRVVVELAYFGGRSQSEIATQLAIPLGTIKSRASLGLRKLAMAMGPSEV